MDRRLRFSLVALALAVGCGSSGSSPASADGAVSTDGDAATEVGDGATDGPPPFTLGLVAPALDCTSYVAHSCTLHVRKDAAPGGDGLSWATAFADVQEALDRATCGCEVWIAEGTYAPTRSLDAPGDAPDPRNLSFVLWPGVKVRGGFAGNEVELLDRRPGTAATILSGDLGAPNVRDDDAYHVVIGADGATLESLTIRSGEANGIGLAQGVGAGLFMFGADMFLSQVALTDNDADSGAGIYADERSTVHLQICTLARNTANDGGALVVLGGDAVIDRSVFTDNVGVFSGPAITDFADTLEVSDTQFSRNRGDSGGALTVSAGTATFDRCWFEGNQAGSFGGAMLVRFGATARLTASVLVANGSVGFGGAIASWTANVEVDGATIVDDTAGFGGGFLVKDGSHLILRDSVVWRSMDDDAGKAFHLDGDGNVIEVGACDIPPEVQSTWAFDADPKLANVPLATRFAVRAGAVDLVPVTGADEIFVVGDRIELGDDGVERHVTAVSGDDLSFAPQLAAAAPRFLRVDRWAADAPNLTLDLTPTMGSPLIDAAGPSAPKLDYSGRTRSGPADIGAIELTP